MLFPQLLCTSIKAALYTGATCLTWRRFIWVFPAFLGLLLIRCPFKKARHLLSAQWSAVSIPALLYLIADTLYGFFFLLPHWHWRRREALCFCVVHPSVPFLWTQYLVQTVREFLQIWHKHPVGLKDELIRFWCSKVNSQGHCDLKYCMSILVSLMLVSLFPAPNIGQLGLLGQRFLYFTAFIRK